MIMLRCYALHRPQAFLLLSVFLDSLETCSYWCCFITFHFLFVIFLCTYKNTLAIFVQNFTPTADHSDPLFLTSRALLKNATSISTPVFLYSLNVNKISKQNWKKTIGQILLYCVHQQTTKSENSYPKQEKHLPTTASAWKSICN